MLTVRLGALLLGFLALTVAILAAWSRPATGYELSIYTSTPGLYWAGIGLAFTAAAAVTIVDHRDWLAGAGLLLGGLSSISFLGLPVLRGYRYHGLADALTHYGWIDGLRTGAMDGFDLLYPASHSMSGLIAEFGGITTEHAIMLYITLLGGIFLLFVPLSVVAIIDHPRAFAIGAFSGFLILPITNIEFKLHFHAYTVAVFFLPVIIYFTVRYLTSGPRRRPLIRATNGWAVALVVGGSGLLLLHPQVMLNILLLLGGISAVNLWYRHRPTHPLGSLQPIYGVWIVFVVVWTAWIMGHPGTIGVGERVIDAVVAMLTGDAGAGETVDTQADSVARAGGTLVELFAKIFLIPLVYCLVAVYAGLSGVRGTIRSPGSYTDPVMTSFATGGVVLVPFFAMHYAGDMSHLFFRHVGFTLSFAVIFGAVGVHLLADRFSISWSRGLASSTLVVIVVVLMSLSLLAVYPSPYVYNQNHHATDQDMEGYHTAFAHVDDSIAFTGIRSSMDRYQSALAPELPNPGAARVVDGAQLVAPGDDRDGPYYLSISQVDLERELTAYNEVRMERADFATFAGHTSVNQVIDGNEFALYLVDGQA